MPLFLVLSSDNLVIFKGAKHKGNSVALINFLLSPIVNLEFVARIQAGPVLKGVKEKLPSILQSNKALFPDKSVWEKLERITDLGNKTELFDKAWTEIKTK